MRLIDFTTLLAQLAHLRANGNFLCDAPREVVKHGPWLIVDFMHEVKVGRITGELDLSGFELLDFHPAIALVDRPPRWSRHDLERFVRCFSEELNRRRRRGEEDARAEAARAAKVRQGLDPDLVADFGGGEAPWDAVGEFLDDATFERGGGQTLRRRARLRMLDQVRGSHSRVPPGSHLICTRFAPD
jgi:hypothetical protein